MAVKTSLLLTGTTVASFLFGPPVFVPALNGRAVSVSGTRSSPAGQSAGSYGPNSICTVAVRLKLPGGFGKPRAVTTGRR